MAESELAQNFFERHRAKIVFRGPDQCWLWTGAQNRWGYGNVGARGKIRKAHREAYEAVHGEDTAAGLVVRHKCDTPSCCNPAHLELGTVADNVRDMMERGRGVARKGEACGKSKITESVVREIRSLYVRGGGDLNQLGLALRFGVSKSLVGDILRRKVWSHVT